MSRLGVIAAIQSAIQDITEATITMVYVGEPLSVPTTPMAAFWLSQHREDFTTLGDSSTVADFTIRCYWRMQASPDVRETIEAEMWDVVVGIKTALRADSSLGGNAADSRPGDASFGYLEIGGNVYRIATIPLEVNIYSESVIEP